MCISVVYVCGCFCVWLWCLGLQTVLKQSEHADNSGSLKDMSNTVVVVIWQDTTLSPLPPETHVGKVNVCTVVGTVVIGKNRIILHLSIQMFYMGKCCILKARGIANCNHTTKKCRPAHLKKTLRQRLNALGCICALEYFSV